MALIAIAVVSVKRPVRRVKWAAHFMTKQTDRFINCTIFPMIDGYRRGSGYIRTVVTVTATTVIAMLSQTCQVTGAFISGRMALHALIRGNRSPFLSSYMAPVAITVVTMKCSV
jgi:hypothetical protein